MIGDDTYFYRARLPHLERLHQSYYVTFCTKNRYVLPPLARDIVLAHIGRAHGISYTLHSGIVMPDHVHLTMSPYDDVSVGLIMQLIKGASSYYVNKRLRRSGALWQRESFDRVMRNDESIQKKTDYIRNNPVRAGLVDKPEDYPWVWINGPAG